MPILMENKKTRKLTNQRKIHKCNANQNGLIISLYLSLPLSTLLCHLRSIVSVHIVDGDENKYR